jgi:sec-independent protein translocase protein TatC
MKAADDPSAELKPFLDHLEDLRLLIIRCGASLVGGMVVAIPLIPWMFGLLKEPLRLITDSPENFLQTMEVTGAFTATMTMAFWGGLLFSAPLLILFIGAFILPALTRKEQKLLLGCSGFAVALFAFGVWLGYRFTMPFALQAMFSVNQWLGIKAQWTLTSYVAFTTQLLIAFGLSFELPIVLLILGRLGMISSRFLQNHRRHAIIVILIIGAVLTPPDVVSQCIMSIPLYILFEICVWIIWAWEKQKNLVPARVDQKLSPP